MNLLFAAIFLLAIYFIFIHNYEGIQNTPQTIYGVNNAFTGLHCYDNNLPIISVDSNTLTCISKDGTNCLMRDDLKIPTNTILDVNNNIITNGIVCRNDQDKNYNVNTFLSKDGIRQIAGGPNNINTRDVFNDLSANGYYTLQCNQSGLNDPNHWCSKTYNSIQDTCSHFDQFQKSSHLECNDTITTFKNSLSSNILPVTSTLYKTVPIVSGAPPTASMIMSCRNKNCIRGRQAGQSLSTCQSNCNICGKGVCN